MLYAKGHIGLHHRRLDGFEETAEIRIGFIVEDHEAGVDVNGSRRTLAAGNVGVRKDRFVDGYGIGMSADVIVLFEKGQRIAALEKIATAHAGDAGADDR